MRLPKPYDSQPRRLTFKQAAHPRTLAADEDNSVTDICQTLKIGRAELLQHLARRWPPYDTLPQGPSKNRDVVSGPHHQRSGLRRAGLPATTAAPGDHSPATWDLRALGSHQSTR